MKSPQFRQFHGNQVDLLGVLRILLFGDVARDLVERNFGIAPIPVMNSRLFAGAVADFRDHSRNRHNADWKDAASDEMVQEATLASLEPPDHGNADVVLSYRRLCACEKAGKRGNFVSRRDIRYQFQGRL